MSQYVLPGEQGISMPSFYERHHEGLATLFSILDLPEETVDTLANAVAVTQLWAKGDHTQPGYEVHVSAEASRQLRELYQDFDLTEEKPLPAGHYDQLLVLGGKQRGNNRRLAFTARMLATGHVTTDRLVLLGGQRHLDPLDEKVPLEENLRSIHHKQLTDTWARAAIADPTKVSWETDLIRLAATDQLGAMTLRRLHLRLGNIDPIDRYELDWNGIPVTLKHSLAVHRPGGEPRHNTESCIADWLQDITPREGAVVGFVAGNPHIERTTRSARVILHRLGREDIHLAGGGSAANTQQEHQIFLGEIARNLYEDLRAEA